MATKTKVCPRCGIEKDRETEFGEFYDKNRGYYRTQAYCKTCKNSYYTQKYRNDKEYREACIERFRQRRKTKRHKEQSKIWQKKYKDRIMEDITDTYIRGICKTEDPPKTPEEYEKARTRILLHRINKKLKDGSS